MSNNWIVFSKEKPKENGWYICTVEVPNQQRYVMDLFWNGELQKFIDNRRQYIFDIYIKCMIIWEKYYILTNFVIEPKT